MQIVNRVYNQLSNKVDVDRLTPHCERAKLDTGTHCNYKCEFCYYKTQLNDITEFDAIKQRIDYLVACGIKEADLSGGESSIHNNWFDILDYCVAQNLKVSCLSNGYKFANIEFMKKSKEHGLEEILFSVHGYDKESHNDLVGNRRGFDNIIQAIRNAHDVGIRVRINCTVTHKNYQQLPTSFVALIQELRPLQVNFLTLNYWNDAGMQQHIDYGTITPFIHRTIDILAPIVPEINVRYTPYCFMKGYEKYVCNYYQHIHDTQDWNIAVYNGDIDPVTYKDDPVKALYEAAAVNRNRTYYKKRECTGCKHYYICDGVERQITNVVLSPDPGERITKAMHYRK